MIGLKQDGVYLSASKRREWASERERVERERNSEGGPGCQSCTTVRKTYCEEYAVQEAGHL